MTITMYGADWCGDCRRAKAWFAEHDVAYDYIDLEANPDEVERVLERNNGVKKIPVIVFPDDSHLVEPTNDELAAKMVALAEAEAAQEYVLHDNADAGRLEMRRGDDIISYTDYTDDGTTLTLPYVFTDPEHRGQGHSTRLMNLVVDHAASTGRTITPICPVAVAHKRRNPQRYAALTTD